MDNPTLDFKNLLHRHPGLEVKKSLDNFHVIVDRKDWEQARIILMGNTPKKKACWHKKALGMAWPDGGESQLCPDCLKTRHIDVENTEWQDHNYNSIGDWYREAAKLQDKRDDIVPEEPKKESTGIQEPNNYLDIAKKSEYKDYPLNDCLYVNKNQTYVILCPKCNSTLVFNLENVECYSLKCNCHNIVTLNKTTEIIRVSPLW